MDPITAVGLAANVVQLTDAITKVIKYINDAENAPKDRAALAQEVASLLNVLIKLRYKIEESKSTDPWFSGVYALRIEGRPLDQIKGAMEDLARKLRPETGIKRLGKALVWTLDKNEISITLSKIERLKTLVSLVEQGDHL